MFSKGEEVKIKSKGERAMFALILIAICIIMGAVGQILMKTGMSQIGQIGGWSKLVNLNTIVSLITNPLVIGGLLVYAISAFLWLGALSSKNVSSMYPLLSLAYILTAILAAVFLKETITLVKWLGIGLIIIGCFMILRS